MEGRILQIGIIAAAAISVVIVAYFALGIGSSVPADEGSAPEIRELSGQIPVGLLAPITGTLSDIGEGYLAITKLAEADVNEYLQTQGHPWAINLIIEDTKSQPDITLERTMDLYERGTRVIVGPVASANVNAIKNYADANGMLVVSCCSSASAVAVPDDNVYRLAAVDTHYIGIQAEAARGHGMDTLIHVYRGDVWGDGITAALQDGFSERGGTVSNWIRYNPDTANFTEVARHLNGMVQEAVKTNERDRVGVVLSGYGENIEIIRAAASYETLDDVTWFGTTTVIGDDRITDDPVAGPFADSVGLYSIALSVPDSPKYRQVEAAMTERLGYPPESFLYAAYDVVWIVALTMLDAQSTDANDMKASIEDVVEEYQGVIGEIRFDDAGDLADADYEVWSISEGQWRLSGQYTQSGGYVVLDDSGT